MGFCKPMSEEVPLINTKTISKEELDAQRENAAKVQAVLQSRYTDKPLACVITYGCQQNVADSEHIKGMLADMGYAFTDDRHKAQFILFNTCAVREHAEDRVFGNVGALKSYREILAFSEGKRLDEIEQKVEAGKRPYQKVLLALLTTGITLLVGMVLSWLLL